VRKMIGFCLCLFLLAPCAASAAEGPKYIALTFDGGPWDSSTRRLLEGLDQRSVRATFFLRGSRIAREPELTARILRAGHEIGLQSFDAADLSGLSRREIARELEEAAALLPRPVRLFRPPAGRCSDAVAQVARARGYALVFWSLDPRDWAARDSAAVSRTILDQVRDGDVIRMYDMTDTSVDAALNAVDLLRDRGFTFVTLSELARLRGARIRPGREYRSFPPWEET